MSNKQIVTGIGIVVVGVIIALLIFNSTAPSISIVGTWQQRGGPELDQFYPDGTVTITINRMTFVGTYKFIDGHTIRLDMQGLLGTTSEVRRVDANGNTMTLTTNTGVSVQYDRVD